MASPSANDISALDVTGNDYLSTQWPSLVRSIQYLQSIQSGAIGLGGAPQSITLTSDAAIGAISIVLLLNPQTGNSDVLSNIPVNFGSHSYAEGQLIFVGLENQGTAPNFKSLKVVSAAGGSGQLILKDVSFYLNRTEQLVVFQLRGSNWIEILRSGREYLRTVLGTGPTVMPPLVGVSEPTFLAPFTSSSNVLKYFKDSDGICHVQLIVNSGATSLDLPIYTILNTPLPSAYSPVFASYYPGVLLHATTTLPVVINIDTGGLIYYLHVPAVSLTQAAIYASFSYPTV